MVAPRTWAGQFFEGSNFLLLARIVGVDQQTVNQDWFTGSGGVELNIYDVTSGGQTLCYTATPNFNDPAWTGASFDVIATASGLNTGAGWPDTSSGFNLALAVQESGWTSGLEPVGGRLYLAEALVTPSATNYTHNGVITQAWRLRCLPVAS